ncbi:uncharacterized protein F54H12.2-like [Uloborus diversus]|uniref:uncharacterized protein F54H12.2-like n=1 Tax=Uloborus diversus TaxID=327109 RepID=UPI00240A43CD|nr:uncharacterized protein F54H12.2-like [Uloborus diversus]
MSKNLICLKSELDLFQDVPMQLGIDSSTFVEIHPIASLTEHSPIEFLISSSGNQYVDISHTLLHLQLQVLKADDTLLTDTEKLKVAPINYLLNTIFSECGVFLNDKQVSTQVNYAYRSYLESLLFYSKNAHDSLLTTSFFHKDTANHHDSITADNVGFKKRSELSNLSKVIDLIGPIHFDLANQPKLLIHGVSVRIKLERNKNSFCLMSATNDFKINILSASLYVRKVNIAPSIIVAHEKALEKGVIKMPIRRVEIKSFSLSAGIASEHIANAFLGQLPNRLIMGLVSNEAYNGAYSKNPFKFHHFDLSYLAVL